MKSEDYKYRIRRIIQWALFILSFSIILWEFTQYKTWFAGMILGITIGTINLLYTAWKVHKVAENAIQSAGKQKRASLGTMTRYSLAILATVFAMQFPEFFSVVGMAVGLIIPPFVAYVDAVYMNVRKL